MIIEETKERIDENKNKSRELALDIAKNTDLKGKELFAKQRELNKICKENELLMLRQKQYLTAHDIFPEQNYNDVTVKHIASMYNAGLTMSFIANYFEIDRGILEREVIPLSYFKELADRKVHLENREREFSR